MYASARKAASSHGSKEASHRSFSSPRFFGSAYGQDEGQWRQASKELAGIAGGGERRDCGAKAEECLAPFGADPHRWTRPKTFYKYPSSFNTFVFALIPLLYPPSFPSDLMTLWQGILESKFLFKIFPTAL